MPERLIILLVESTAATWTTLIMNREKPSGQVEVADVAEEEEILVADTLLMVTSYSSALS